MSAPPSDAKPKRRWKRRLIWIASPFVLLVGFYAGAYFYYRHERNQLIAELRAAGEIIEWNEYADKVIASRKDGRGGELLRQAIEAHKELEARLKRRVPSLEVEDLVEQAEKSRPQKYPSFEGELQILKPVVVALHQAGAETGGMFVTDEQFRSAGLSVGPWDLFNVDYGLMRVLSVVRVDSLGRDDVSGALDSVRTGLGLAKLFGQVPLFPFQEASARCFDEAARGLLRTLEAAQLNEAEYEELDQVLGAWDVREGVRNSVRTDVARRVSVLNGFSAFRDAAREAIAHRGLDRDPSLDANIQIWQYEVLGSPLGWPLLMRVQSDALRDAMYVLERCDSPKFSATLPPRRPPHELATGVLHLTGQADHPQSIRTVHLANVSAMMARWGLRVCRHFDRNGTLPASLQDVCDAEMLKTHAEWFGEASPTFEPRRDGFEIRSLLFRPQPVGRVQVYECVRVKFPPHRLKQTR